MEPAVISGVVSLKRARSPLPSSRVSALRAEVCVRCGYADVYAEKPERLFSERRAEGG